MGAVYLAQDEQLDRRVALKVPLFTLLDGPEILERFDREARAAASLDHPHLCPVFDVGQINGIRYLTMPYIEGHPLSELIDPDNPVPQGRAAAMVRTLALAMHEAHSRGIVHRDLKPANVLVNRRGEPVIMDFGLARGFDPGDPRMTQSGMLLGTPSYMAPEQVVGDPRRIGPACDIYSLGVILYELLAGRRPFEGPVPVVLAQALTAEPPRPSEHRPGLDPALEAICLKAMAKAPEDRHPSMAAFAAALGASPGETWGPSGPASAVSGRSGIPGTSARGSGGPAGSADFFIRLAPPEAEPLSDPSTGSSRRRRSGLYPVGISVATAILLVTALWFVATRYHDTSSGLAAKAGARPVLAQAPPTPGASPGEAGPNAPDPSASTSDIPSVDPPKEPDDRSSPPPAGAGPAGNAPTNPPPASTSPGRGKLLAPRDAPEIREAIRGGVGYLVGRQNPDGSWPDAVADCPTGTTSLVVLALLAAGEPPDSPVIARASEFLQRFSATELGRTYSVALHAMVFAAIDPGRHQLRIAADVAWLERAQIKPNDRVGSPGSWTYKAAKEQPGDNSNTQYALLALDAAAAAGIPTDPKVWALARRYWEGSQMRDGSWNYSTTSSNNATLSMTCAGIAGLTLADRWQNITGEQILPDGTIRNCGKGAFNLGLQRGIDALTIHLRADQNFGQTDNANSWNYYYLAGLERAGRLAGSVYFGNHDWYAEGAEHLLKTPQRDKAAGSWTGSGAVEGNPLVATSFALTFLARGGAPVLITKLTHGSGNDWRNDPADVANLIDLAARERRRPMRWGVARPSYHSAAELQRSPILLINGHKAPEFDAAARSRLREYIDGGGFLLADSCCGKDEFDRGFRDLMKVLLPEPEHELHPLPEDHPIWKGRHILSPDANPLWGIDHGGRTAVVYSPTDLSCFWEQARFQPDNPLVIKALRVGRNVVEYAVDLD